MVVTNFLLNYCIWYKGAPGPGVEARKGKKKGGGINILESETSFWHLNDNSVERRNIVTTKVIVKRRTSFFPSLVVEQRKHLTNDFV
jgi:hypothetical protein